MKRQSPNGEPASIQELTDRLWKLEAEQSIVSTMNRYAHTIDYGLEEEWVDCFTPDGIWEVRRPGEKPWRYEGREALTAFIPTHPRAPELWFKHLNIEPQFSISGDHAEVDSYVLRIQEHETGPYIQMFGRYRDKLSLCEDGRWRFTHRIAEVEGIHPLGAVPNRRDPNAKAK